MTTGRINQVAAVNGGAAGGNLVTLDPLAIIQVFEIIFTSQERTGFIKVCTVVGIPQLSVATNRAGIRGW